MQKAKSDVLKVPLEFATKINLNEDESEFTTFLIQTRALIWKNYLLFTRKMRILLFMFLTPIAVGFMLDLIIQLGNVLHSHTVLDFPLAHINDVPHCRNGYNYNPYKDQPCVSVGYSIIGENPDINAPEYQRYHDLMKIFTKNREGWDYGKDVKPLTVGKQKHMT